VTKLIQIDASAHEIVLDGRRQRVRRKLMDLIIYLSSANGRVVARGELLDHIWTHRPASDESLTQLISELRRTLGDSALQTIPGKGYRLLAQVAPCPPMAVAPLEGVADLASSDRRWGFAFLLALFLGAQALAMLFGVGGH
jgi:hypothetical protein